MGAVKQKRRGKVQRTRTRLVVIGAEGNNKTERIYFSELFKDNSEYKAKFASADETDPEGMVYAIQRFIEKEDIELAAGDFAFCLVDTDTDIEKQERIRKAIQYANKHEIEVILSNPCFEVWFLQHFRYSTKPYNRSAEAIRNATKLEEYHKSLGRNLDSMECNPSTSVYKILEI